MKSILVPALMMMLLSVSALAQENQTATVWAPVAPAKGKWVITTAPRIADDDMGLDKSAPLEYRSVWAPQFDTQPECQDAVATLRTESSKDTDLALKAGPKYLRDALMREGEANAMRCEQSDGSANYAPRRVTLAKGGSGQGAKIDYIFANSK